MATDKSFLWVLLSCRNLVVVCVCALQLGVFSVWKSLLESYDVSVVDSESEIEKVSNIKVTYSLGGYCQLF